MNINSLLPREKGFGSIGTTNYTWGNCFVDSANFIYTNIASNIKLTSLSSLNIFSDTTGKLYNQENELYWAGDPIMTGTIQDIIDYINNSDTIEYESIKGLPSFDTSDDSKYLNVYNGSLRWHKPIVGWTDVGGPALNSSSIGKYLKVKTDGTGLEWADDFDINSLSTADPDLDDYLAFEDTSASNSARKATIETVIDKYTAKKAQEQAALDKQVRDSGGNLVENPNTQVTTGGQYVNGVWVPDNVQNVTSENLDSLIAEDGGINIITTCRNASYQVVSCNSSSVKYKTKQLEVKGPVDYTDLTWTRLGFDNGIVIHKGASIGKTYFNLLSYDIPSDTKLVALIDDCNQGAMSWYYYNESSGDFDIRKTTWGANNWDGDHWAIYPIYRGKPRFRYGSNVGDHWKSTAAVGQTHNTPFYQSRSPGPNWDYVWADGAAYFGPETRDHTNDHILKIVAYAT